MSNPFEKGVCGKNKQKRNKFVIIVEYTDVVMNILFVAKKNHIGYQNKTRYRFTPQSQSKNNQSDVSECEQKKSKLNRTTIYCWKYKMILTDELDLCDDGNILSKKEKLLKIGKFIGVEAKTCEF